MLILMLNVVLQAVSFFRYGRISAQLSSIFSAQY